MAKTTIYLIRHGETDYNSRGVFQGGMDTELNEQGRMQAEKLGEYLRGLPFAALYCSDLRRTAQTAAPLAAYIDMQPEVLPALREVDFGAWEGHDLAYIGENYPQEARLWREDADRLRIPGGESLAEARQRAYDCLCELARRHEGQTIAVFSHGGTIRLLLSRLLSCPCTTMWRLKQYNCGVNILSHTQDGFCVEQLNYNGFLSGRRD